MHRDILQNNAYIRKINRESHGDLDMVRTLQRLPKHSRPKVPRITILAIWQLIPATERQLVPPNAG